MQSKLLPILLLLIGTGGGIGAGIFMMPADSTEEAAAAKEEEKAEEEEIDPEAGPNEYVKMSNQFVIPIVHKDKVASHVVMSLNIEVPPGKRDSVYTREPKLRASFLRVLFDHANMGGFKGAFTMSGQLDPLREALLEIARLEAGEEVIDVLIVDIARQDTH